jgi:hypothetical protein
MACNFTLVFRVCGESGGRAYGAGLSGILSQKLSKGLVFGPALLFCPLRIWPVAEQDSALRSFLNGQRANDAFATQSKTTRIPLAASFGAPKGRGNPPEMQFHQAKTTQFRRFAPAISCAMRNHAPFFRICSKTCLTA